MIFSLLPVSFYVVALLILIGFAYASTGFMRGWGIPAIVVLLTVSAWYLGDALYNDYQEYFWQFGIDTLSNSWWQVGGFVLAFILMVRPVSEGMNRRLASEESFAMRMYEGRLKDEADVQHRIDQAFGGLLATWMILTVIGLYRTNWNFAGVFAPYLTGFTTNPWGRAQIGGGFDAVLALAGYVQLFLTATFGVIWAVSKNPRTRWLAGVAFLLAAPLYLFDRTRNVMLAAVVPGALTWVLLRLRTTWLVRGAVIVAMFMVINFWLLFVVNTRGENTIARAITTATAFELGDDAAHQGLNMFAELAWINHFMKLGTYEPNWGHRYFAEVANIVPRALWPGKPTIGLDYAIARGQVASETTGMVTATVSTGMIGQGVVNFGRILGPIFAAWLMALWVGLLARQDRMSEEHPARFLLYAMGLILTFNMGRDITPLVCYPFFFGYALVYYFEKKRAPRVRGTGQLGEGVSGDHAVSHSRASVIRKTGASSADRETADQRRDVGTGGTVRSLPTQTPKRIARWMPRRVRAAVVAAQSAVEEGAGAKPQIGGQIPETNGQSSEVKQRPRQVAVPFQNYRRYRG